MVVSKFPKLGLPQIWGFITLCANLWLKWSQKKSCSPHQDLSNDMLHATYTQGNWGDFRLLVVGSQIVNLIPDLSFAQNLYFRCPNGSCEPILDIHASIAFQWYKDCFNPMGFNPYNCPLKIWKSIETPIPKMGVHLGVWRFIPSHSFTFLGTWDMTPGLPSWPATLQALTLVASPRLGLQHLDDVKKNNCDHQIWFEWMEHDTFWVEKCHKHILTYYGWYLQRVD
jgi:hypothetical protein